VVEFALTNAAHAETDLFVEKKSWKFVGAENAGDFSTVGRGSEFNRLLP
jgi:hypothetical protein